MLSAALDIAELHHHLHNEQYGLLDPIPPSYIEHRCKLMDEEYLELLSAIDNESLEGTLHEGLDLIVTVLGTLIGMGYSPQQISDGWDLIQAANMAKIPDPAGGKWLKPEGWQKPDLSPLIRQENTSG